MPARLSQLAVLPVLAAACFTAHAMPQPLPDIDALWNFTQPAASEQRLRAAAAAAAGDGALLLQTQVARARGLQGDFAGARALLAAIAPAVAAAGPEVRARHALEWGRAHASAAHPAGSVGDAERRTADTAYAQAQAVAEAAALDALAIDALHMRAIVATDADAALAFDRDALARAEASAQPAARRWRASLLHNIGYGLHQRGRFAEALDAFERALALRRESGDADRIQVARWMVAWTLRALDRTDEALAAQQALERDHAAAGTVDRHVFAELVLLHRARGDAAEAARYEALRDATTAR